MSGNNPYGKINLTFSSAEAEQFGSAEMVEEEIIFGDDGYFDEEVTTSRNNYKSKISHHEEVNKPIMAILFNLFNMMSYRRVKNMDKVCEKVTFNGILNGDSIYIDYLPDYPPLLFEYSVLLKINGNDISFVMMAFKEGYEIKNVVRLSSLDDDDIKSEVIYNELFRLAVDSSNLKGSYLTISDERLEWKIRELKDISFNDVFLPDDLMCDLEMYIKLFEKKGLIPRYMFSGVPGTGKTESTRAISKILNNQKVTIIKTNICKIIKEKFELAKILAPSIMILDDIDLYLGDRNNGSFSPLLGAFLDILDGVDKLPDDVGVIASTNAPHLIDLAAQRPGRFHKLLFFDELTSTNIKSIIEKSLNNLDEKYGKVTKKDRKVLTDSKLVNFFKDEGSTGAFIHEIIQDIKNKSEILDIPLDLDKIIVDIGKKTKNLNDKLKHSVIDNKIKGAKKKIGY